MKDIKDLREQLQTLAKYASALAVLGWDEEVNLPTKAHFYRGEVKAQLASDLHRKLTDPQLVKLVGGLAESSRLENLSSGDQVIIRETWRDIQKAQKLPPEFVEEFAKLTSLAYVAWAEARQKSDFKIYQPLLGKVVAMARREAEYLGYQASPYDALVDSFEPDMTSAQLDNLFGPLKEQLSDLVKRAKEHKQPALPKTSYPVAAQIELCKEVVAAIGYDLEAGRLDQSPHPFTIDFHPTDVRITTRYDEHDFWVSLGAAIHEAGHALYGQGLPADEFGTPLGEPVSLGIHESQSRLWENFVGRSRAFCDFLYPLLQKHFGKLKYDAADLHAWLNRAQPSMIRVEADETTYNLHIILRYEIEKALVENSLQVAELPRIWNAKMHSYLGLTPSNDAEGVLQDVHWAHGSIGYFPTYSLGNVYAAQLYKKALEEIKGLEAGFAKGQFKPLLKWLRQNIHSQGRRLSAVQLIEQVTDEPPNSEYLLGHLKSKLNA